jgi:hypothetical protein
MVLVAPALPLPWLRMSSLKYRFPTQTAVGIEPSKYARIAASITSKLSIAFSI